VAVSDSLVVVGAAYDGDGGARSGSVYLFSAASPYSQLQKLTASDPAAEDYFGKAVAVSASLVVVGAAYDDDGGAGSGSVYLFSASSPYSQLDKLTSTGSVRITKDSLAIPASDPSKIFAGAGLNSYDNYDVVVLDAAQPPPPASPGATSSITGDPHLRGAHGGDADFKGGHRAVYSALSAKNLSVNLMTEHDSFVTPFSRLGVHGSWVRAIFHTIWTRATGRVLRVFFHAIDPHRAIITEGCTAPFCRDGHGHGQRYEVRDGARPFIAENVHVSLRRKTLTVATGQWLTTSSSTVGLPHPGKLRMNLEVKPTYAVDYDPVAPHGLLGQTYDRDMLEVNGKRDDYSRLDDGWLTTSRHGVGGTVTTRANAEGAIEGVLEDYRVRSDFATAFRFSRFDAVAAPVRNVSALGGVVGPMHSHARGLRL